MTTPVFLISLPRSGSTLLQKILMSHDSIASTGEPWFLLPLVYMNRASGVHSEYGHETSVLALRSLIDKCGIEFIHEQMRIFSEAIYSQFCLGGEVFFLDKTPRYYYILDDLIQIFPEAKFIVLLRNPVSVFSSSVEAFRNNSMRRLDHLDGDFYRGPEKIGRFVSVYSDRIHVLKYEELIQEPQNEVKKICEYLDLKYSDDMVERSFGIQLQGYGDHLGAREYQEVVKDIDKSQHVISTPYRKGRLMGYIRKYSEAYLDAGGYSKDDLIKRAKGYAANSFSVFEYFMYLEELVVKSVKRFLNRTWGS